MATLAQNCLRTRFLTNVLYKEKRTRDFLFFPQVVENAAFAFRLQDKKKEQIDLQKFPSFWKERSCNVQVLQAWELETFILFESDPLCLLTMHAD